MTEELFDVESGREALNRVRHWHGLLDGAGDDVAAQEEIVTQKLVAGSEAVAFGIAEETVQAAGEFSARQMDEVRAGAAEIRADDEEIARHTRAAAPENEERR
ncbi:hypothetical protein NDR87_07185 [Nocardia sp. CDC159]|uniref:Uncharacterized protein n=1 Tax=Nocardia pulmonis TaxID=2951408 RepID=A0A9X2E5K9_9NOCA|nr:MULTISPECIES: hypothetical protein [Nocardia]MCM6773250.1 hypothetical protein [Nocardia pulmonis]MCM6786137.1 hypothetical protein [Nocardia sp. CDC159]